MKKYVVVIGAANIDIGGTPYNELLREDSNPGKINISYGGVGRNIADNLSKLGLDVILIAAVGKDALGRDLLDYCKKCGINTDYVITDDNSSSSMYMYINNKHGDMAIALSDVDIAEKVTPEYIDSVTDLINNAEVVIMDCNLSHETCTHIAKICKVPLFVDPVSQSHASKIKDHLRGIDVIKPNRLEAQFLTGINIETEEDYKKAADKFFENGIRKVFISMGSKGMFAASDNQYFMIDKYPTEVKSTTGAGDSAAAAIVWSLINNDKDDILTAAKAANAAASITVNSHKTINSRISSELITDLMAENKMKIREI